MPLPKNPLRTWLQLLRAPNLLTVPGDPLAGYFLACFGAVDTPLWRPVLASLCFYGAGLLLNDLADLAEDRRERPGRPLPSGAASPRTTFAVLLLLLTLGLGLCWQIERSTFALGGVLVLAIALYNLYTKRLAIVGALNMGACRGLSMLLGATAVSHGDLTLPLIARGRLDHLVAGVAVVTAYIAAVTHLARHETQPRVSALPKLLPSLAMLAGLGVLYSHLHLDRGLRLYWEALDWRHGLDGLTGSLPPNAAVVSLIILAIAALNALNVSTLLLRDGTAPIPPQIGNLIRLLLLIQAAICAACATLESMLMAIVLVLLWPLARLLGRWFYAS